MRRLIDFLTPIGLAVIAAAVHFEGRGRLYGPLRYYVIGGAVLIALHLVLRARDIDRAFRSRGVSVGKRQLQYGGNTLVMILAVLAILGLANYFTNKYNKTWDLTKSSRFSLAEQTKKVVGGLKEDVTITHFHPSIDMGQVRQAKDRLEAYQALSPKIKFQLVDPDVKPDVARKYDVRPPFPTVFVEHGGRQEKITTDSEQDLTNAIIRVTHEKRQACFVSGYGERSIDDSERSGYSQVKDLLGKSGYDVEKLALVQKPEIPATCSVVVVPGPRKDFDAPLIDGLRKYVKDGGKLLLMIDFVPKIAFPNLSALAKEWNIDVGNDIVLELTPIGQLVGIGGGPESPAIVKYPYHEITKDMSQQELVTVFHAAHSVRAGTGHIEGVIVQNLTETTPNSWGETNLDENAGAKRDDKDTPGPLSVAAVATIGGGTPSAHGEEKKDEEKKEKEGRVVVYGDTDFASNYLIGAGFNQDLFMNTVAWLAKDADTISIRPKDADGNRMVMNPWQQRFVILTSVVGLPFLFVAAAVATWWFRRG